MSRGVRPASDAGPYIEIVWHQVPGGGAADLDIAEWSLCGVPVRARTASPAEQPPDMEPLQVTRAGHRIDIAAPSWSAARERAAPFAAAFAAHHGRRVLLRCGVVVDATGQADLVIGPASLMAAATFHAQAAIIDTQGTAPWAIPLGDDLLGARERVSGEEEFPLRAVVLLSPDGDIEYLLPKEARSQLGAHAGLSGRMLMDVMVDRDGSSVMYEIEHATELCVHNLAIALPVFRLPAAALQEWTRGPRASLPDGAWPTALASYSAASLAGLRELQAVADGVYGRLEPERAITWTVEELGELAQAIRRREPPARIAEELGQVFAWMLCLANICETDLANAAAQSLRHEVMRQARKYGALRPYVPIAPFRSRA